jgi:putative ABC transport system permease protein
MKTLSLVWKQFTQRKLRSALTIIGILIGIASLVSLILLSSSLKFGVTKQLDRFGSDIILVAPLASLNSQGGPSGTGKFSLDDVKTIEQIPQIIEVYDIIRQSFPTSFGRQTIQSDIRGYALDKNIQGGGFKEFIKLDLLDGRYLESGDTYVVNIGYRLAKEGFDKEIFVGNSLYINDVKFTVVGIFQSEGTQSLDFLIATSATAMRKLVGDSKAVTAISARVAPGADLDIMKERITQALERSRGKEDFGITTPKEIQQSIGSFLQAIDIVVLSVAIISLFVGALGIMNSLYTSVLQRTREIGTLKAIGATNGQILRIFLLESAILGFFGGLFGILSGIALAFVFISGINVFGFVKLDFIPDVQLFIFALLFSIVLGIISGLLPALRASRLKPVDALRYE